MLDSCLLGQRDVVSVDDSREKAKEAQQQVDDDSSIVSFHQVNGEWRHPETQQVGEQIDLIQGEVVQDRDRPAAEAEEEVNPILRVTFSVQKDRNVREAHSKESFHASHGCLL